MTFSTEVSSWCSPKAVELSAAPQIGSKAPSCPELPLPAANGKPTIVTFLRHCGCPVAEATFLDIRKASSQQPDINFIAVSHSDEPSTTKWVTAVRGMGEPRSSNTVTVLVDPERKIYAQWGLGTTSWSHVLSLKALMNIIKLGSEKGIWNRPTESGTRWQSGGFWAVDASGVVRWGRAARRADDYIDVDEAIKAVGT
ncbi:hypothetical protein ZTR_10517 [Talaromyces verruculosus]|nr:hypothetical protein ZTR_10517 [Talaromyces verruculosus]